MTTHDMLAAIAYLLTTVWLASLWQGALLVLSGSLLLRLMPGAPAGLRHGLLMALFLISAVLPWIPLHRAAPSTGSPHVHLSLQIAFVFAALWAMATLYRLSSLVMAGFHLRAVRRKATPIDFDLNRLGLSGKRRPAVCTSADVDSPLIVGFFRPVMLLPEWLMPSLSAEELDQIAVHECEHLRRRDDWTNLALQLGLTLFPLNPALLWLNRRIAVQRELACDAAVAAVACPVDYAASLARIAEHRLHRNKLRFALAVLGRQSELAHRVQVLLRERKKWSSLQSATSTVATGVVLSAAACVLTHTPQFVSVDSPSVMTLVSSSAHDLALPGLPTPSSLRMSDGQSTHFVPTSYVAPNVTAFHRRTTHKAVPSPRKRQDFELTSTALTHRSSAFRMTSAFIDREPAPAARKAVAPAQALDALYSPAYLAVPVTDGWLIIQI